MENSNESKILNPLNPVVRQREINKFILDKEKYTIDELKKEISKLDFEIDNLSEKIGFYQGIYKEKSKRILNDKYKLHKESRYAKKMAKVSVDADLFMIEGRKTNRQMDKITSLSKITVSKHINEKIKKITSINLENSIDNANKIKNEIISTSNSKTEIKNTREELITELQKLKEEKRLKEKELLKCYKKYYEAYKEYQKTNKTIKKGAKEELNASKAKTL